MKRPKFRPTFELLESRRTPAGNVLAHAFGGSLVLIGDRFDNAVAVTQPAPNQFTVTPEDGTTINGSPDPLTVSGITRDLVALFGGGNDRLRLGDFFGPEITVGRDLMVFGGDGDNVAESFAPLTVGRDLWVSNGRGNDRTELRGTPLTVGRDVAVFGGAGDNTTAIAPDFGTNTVGRDLRVVNGAGNDSNQISDTNVGRDVTIDNGPGGGEFAFTDTAFGPGFNGGRVTVGGDVTFRTLSGAGRYALTETDVGGDVLFDAGQSGGWEHQIGARGGNGPVTVGGDVTVRGSRTGADGVSLGAVGFQPGADAGLSVGRDLRVTTGGDADTATLIRVTVTRSAALDAGDGDDRVLIDDSTFAGSFALAAGRGADVVDVERRAATSFEVVLDAPTAFQKAAAIDLGRDDDVLRLGVAGDPTRVVRPGGSARFDGGPGTDVRDAQNMVSSGKAPQYVNFEADAPPPLFLGPVRYPIGGEYVIALESADFDGDGDADLVTVNQDSRNVSVLLNNGDGTFGPSAEFAAGRTPADVAVADFNADGNADLAVANNFGPSGTVSVLLGNGDGTFQPRVAFSAGPGVAVAAVEVGDFNEDGRPDVATGNRTGNNEASVSILLGNGDGTLGAATVVQLGQINAPNGVAVGDLNGDGNLDVVATALRGVGVLLGHGDGSFQAPAVEARPVVVGVTLADFNTDGKLDALFGGNDLRVQLGNGDGTFGPPAVLLDQGVSGMDVCDFNRDGKQDVAVAHFPEAGTVFLGNGDGTFRAGRAFDPGLDDGPVLVADFNGDGWDDLAVGNQEARSVSVLVNSKRG